MAGRLAIVSALTALACVAAIGSAVVFRTIQGGNAPSGPQVSHPTESSTTGSLAARPSAPAPTRVAVTASACDPADLSVTAGTTAFEIVNQSSRVLEWEILDGVMVVEERENIAPGFTQRLTAKLSPGEYQITCGLLSNPHGRLHVADATASAQGAPTRKLGLMELIGPVAEYKVYLTGETTALVDATRRFTDAVRAGDVVGAKGLYAPARLHYQRIKPVAELFSDLDDAIDARAEKYRKREQDPGFSGFRRLAYGLSTQNTTTGLGPGADKLDQDVTALKARVHDLTIMPDKMVRGAAALIEEVAAIKITGEKDRNAQVDLADVWANVEGARKIVTLLQPLTTRFDASYQSSLDADFARVEAVLARARRPDGGFKTFAEVSDVEWLAVQGPITTLSQNLSRLQGILDLA